MVSLLVTHILSGYLRLRISSRVFSAFVIFNLVAGVSLHAVETTQSISLAQGWNAVWLEVDPIVQAGENAGTNKAVTEVFSNAAIDVVVRPLYNHGSSEFVQNIGTADFKQKGWQAWYRSSELNENTLALIEGYQAYLIKASSAVTISVTGEARYMKPEWTPYSYNLVGFGLHSPVTFGQFFGDVAADFPVNRIFQLNAATGAWEGVGSNSLMVSGRAYWIYCQGGVDFTGPVKVAFNGVGGIDYADRPANNQIPDPESNTGGMLDVSLQEVIFTNISDRAQSVTFTKLIPNTGGGSISDELRIFDVVPTPNSLSYEAGEGLLNSTTYSVASLTSTVATLGADRNWSTGAERRENLYRLNFEYHYLWLPIAASNRNLNDAVLSSATPGAAGLWAGEVIVDGITSLTDAGRPVTPTTSNAPLRVILHEDATGNVSLLSHVMLMQTKTADISLAPETVLVLNETKIPFYEGIEERGGKRVGIRLESTNFDMPRDYTPTSNEAIRTLVGDYERQNNASFLDSNVTAEQVQAWIALQSTRPPALEENYTLKFPMNGTLGGNQEVRTSTSLTLDAFHRSNPFRHAYHPSHGTGRNIARDIVIQFDDSDTPDLLQGAYTETVTGLGAVPLVSTGSISLQRISTASGLIE